VGHGPPSDRRRTIQSWRRAIGLFVLAQLACAACTRGSARATDIAIHLSAAPAIVDRDTVVEFVLSDAAGKPVPGASLTVQAHMTHPGMAPIIEPAVDAGEGRYEVRLRFTMAGAWVLAAKGTLDDRRAIDQKIGEMTVRPAE
jgi:hypothetical protein